MLWIDLKLKMFKNHSTLLIVNEILLNNNFEDSKFSQRSLKIIPK